ncbi:hypothetical protein D3C73_1215870 [compost metagenome]
MGRLGVIACQRLCRIDGRLTLDAVDRWQINRPGVNAIGRLIAVGGVAGSIGVLVDLRCGGQGDQQQDENETTTHELDQK